MACRVDCDHHVHSMDALVAYAQNRVRRNKHFIIGAFGNPGAGKSEVLLTFLSECQGTPLDIRTQVAYRPKDVKPMSEALFNRRGRYVAILDDEATGEGGHKRQPMTKENVESVQDFDAMRGRNQYVGMCAPRRVDLDRIKQGHLMWALEITEDHHITGYEGIKGSPMWDSETWWEERFSNVKAPNLQELMPWGPKLRSDYLAGKDNHMKGGTTDKAQTVESLEERYATVISRFYATKRV